MKQYCVSYQEKETMPDRLEALASKLGLTPEQLIKRFIAKGIAGANPSNEPAEPGTSLGDFLVKNGVWKQNL
jgi:hypothetical protein